MTVTELSALPAALISRVQPSRMSGGWRPGCAPSGLHHAMRLVGDTAHDTSRPRAKAKAQLVEIDVGVEEKPDAPPVWHHFVPNPAHRALIESEEAYGSELRAVCDHWLAPLRELALLPSSDLRALFSNVEHLLRISEELLQQLMDPARQTPEGAAVVLMDAAPTLLKAYSVFASDAAHSKESLAKLAKLRERQGWDSALEAAMHDAQASVGEDLSVMLEKPALRLAQYPDLLKELIISLPPAHAAHPDLAAAVGAMEEVVQNVHSWHGEVQWMSGMRQLASTLAMGDTRHGPTLEMGLLSTSRGLALSVEAEGADAGGDTGIASTEDRPYTIHLCTDLILLTQPQSGAIGGAGKAIGGACGKIGGVLPLGFGDAIGGAMGGAGKVLGSACGAIGNRVGGALGGGALGEASPASLVAISPLNQAQLQAVGSGVDRTTGLATRILELKLPRGTKTSAATMIAAASSAAPPPPSNWEYYLLTLPRTKAEETLALFGQLQSRHAASKMALVNAVVAKPAIKSVSRGQVRQVLEAVEQLDDRMARLSTRGSTLAHELGEGGGPPASPRRTGKRPSASWPKPA